MQNAVVTFLMVHIPVRNTDSQEKSIANRLIKVLYSMDLLKSVVNNAAEAVCFYTCGKRKDNYVAVKLDRNDRS